MRVRGVRPRVLAAAVVLILALALVAGVVWLRQLRTTPGPEAGVAAVSAESTPSLAATFPEAPRTLRNPLGVAVDGRRVYVAESDASAVRVFGTDGAALATLAVPPAAGAPVAYPADVAVLAEGRLAVLDTAGARVLLLDEKGGRLLSVVGSAVTSETLKQPTALAAAAGELYVADAGDHTVSVYGTDGRLKRRMGEALRPPLTFVGGMAVVGDVLYVADSNAGRVVALDRSSGAQRAVLPAAFSLPRGLAAGPRGTLILADAFERKVVSFAASGTPAFTLGGRESGERDPMRSPRGVAYSSAEGRLYVTDAVAGTVRVYAFAQER